MMFNTVMIVMTDYCDKLVNCKYEVAKMSLLGSVSHSLNQPIIRHSLNISLFPVAPILVRET